MTDEELDLMLQKVLTDAAELDCAPEASDGTFTPSRSHERAMRSMLADPDGWARKRSRPVWKKVLQAAAAAVIALLVGFGGLMAVSPEARAAVNRWITDEGDGYVTYTYSGDRDGTELPRYVITSLPEGYVEGKRFEYPDYVNTIFENGSGGVVSFGWAYMREGSGIVFTTDGYEVVDVKIGSLPGQLLIPEDPDWMLTLTWIDPKANIQFTVQGTLDRDAILKLAESVKKEK